MSWLTGGLTSSVTGRISQLGGQLKDILTESTEDIVDPNTELKVLNDKLKENEKHIELLKMESSRWRDESNESNMKYQTLEAQFEQRSNEYRQQLLAKDSQINELRKQINSLQEFKSESMDSNHQKSALMEEFEELMPPSDLNDYINLQKEIKRLNEDNLHLSNENKQLLNKLKSFEASSQQQHKDNAPASSLLFNDQQKQEYENTIKDLKQKLFKFKTRLQTDKDKHQEEIIAIQNSYAEKKSAQMIETQNELEIQRLKIEELQLKLDELNKEKSYTAADSAPTSSKISSNKSDDGWCLNGDEVHFESEEKIEIKNLKSQLNEKDSELNRLQTQIDMFESELEQANVLILRLKAMNKQQSPKPFTQDDSIIIKKDQEIDQLKSRAETLEKENDKLRNLSELLTKEKEKNEKLSTELEQQDKVIDSLTLELKQYQQTLQQEKLMQMQEQKQERQDMSKLKLENTDLKIKLDEKLSEIKLLGDQINDLNININSLKSTDSNLFSELKQKTEQFMSELDLANNEIQMLKNERENLIEQRKQFEYVLDEKIRESSQLKTDIQKHLHHIAAQSKAIEKLQSELKQKDESEPLETGPAAATNNETHLVEELNQLKQQYNQIYGYLETKNQESQSYYNEIQRLNLVLSDLNRELQNAKSMNENLSDQYENLVKECQYEQKIVEDLNQQMYELNRTLLNTGQHSNNETQFEDKLKETNDAEAQTDLENQDQKVIIETDDKLKLEYSRTLEELEQVRAKLNETINNYENIINVQNESFKQSLLNEEKQQTSLSNELNMMRAHMTEMSNNYNREFAQSEEREKQLRIALNEAQDLFKKQTAGLENANREIEFYKNNSSKFEEAKYYYENVLNSQNDSFKHAFAQEEQQRLRLSKELERLKEHLVEMSDSYTKDAIQAEEREKQLRLALNDAQQKLQRQNADLESSSKEIEFKCESLNQINLDLKAERDKLRDKLKQTEETLAHQVKVTKNLDLVLERLQNEKDSQHTLEISKYQQTIKDHANTIHSLQKEAQNNQNQIENLKSSLETANIIKAELERKEEILKQYQAQIATKDSLIESLDKRFHEVQKLNDSYIEKEIIKNLIIGYIKVSQQNEKKQVLKLISTMLSFSQKELELVESAGETKWFGLLKAPASTPSKLGASGGASSNEKSFAELLIQYVDRESKPKPNLTFDINSTNKKTDSPSKLTHNNNNNNNTNDDGSSASALSFFNRNLSTSSSPVEDLNLVNRSNQTSSSNNATTTTSAITGLSSPAVANSFLEQILKS